MKRFNRRKFLKLMTTTGAMGILPPNVLSAVFGEPLSRSRRGILRGIRAPLPRRLKIIGTDSWVPTNPSFNHEIEGYSSATSINIGEKITFHVNIDSDTDVDYQIEIFRLGYYSGTGGRRMTSPIHLKGRRQPAPSYVDVPGEAGPVGTGQTLQVLECQWEPAYTLRAKGFSSQWPSGVYIAKLKVLSGSATIIGKESLIKFVVRDDFRLKFLQRRDPRNRTILFQTSDATYQAYNAWGGKSLYEFNSTNTQPALAVSFNRPYEEGIGAGQFFSWEYPMIRFLEREGYDVIYCTSIDTHLDSDWRFSRGQLDHARCFLSVGHDEYWSAEMRDNVTRARDNGTHLGFFSANTCYWQIRIADSAVSKNKVARTIVGYKDNIALDPLNGTARATTKWRNLNRPESQLLGVQYNYFPVDGDVVVNAYNLSSGTTIVPTEHWIFHGTGVQNGDKLYGLLGYEVDEINLFTPPNTLVLCESPANQTIDTPKGILPLVDDVCETVLAERVGDTGAIDNPNPNPLRPGFSHMTVYPGDLNVDAQRTTIVFATGTIQWSWGLDDYIAFPYPQGLARKLSDPSQVADNCPTQITLPNNRVNPIAQKMTRNVLNKFLGKSR